MSIEKDNSEGIGNKGNPKKLEKLFILGFFSILLAGTPLISQIFGAFLPVPLFTFAIFLPLLQVSIGYSQAQDSNH